MKIISRKERNKISRWEDIPLSDQDKVIYQVYNKAKYREWNYTNEIPFKGESLVWLKNLVNGPRVSEIYLEIVLDGMAENFIESIEIYDNSKGPNGLRIPETNTVYSSRMDALKMKYWKEISLERDRRMKKVRIEEMNKAKKADTEYETYLRLKKKYEK